MIGIGVGSNEQHDHHCGAARARTWGCPYRVAMHRAAITEVYVTTQRMNSTLKIPSNTLYLFYMGSYILVLQLEHPLVGLTIGKFGTFDFAAGYYLYVGSACGAGGVPARLNHHQRRIKARKHWHIDYLREHANLLQAWAVTAKERLECHWCKRMQHIPALTMPIQGFGSRDTGCPSHLFYTPTVPGIQMLTELMIGDLLSDRETNLFLEIYLFEE
jgi:Uri superfamily endonuclease